MKEISLIGSTGSIGRQALSVAAHYPEQFKIRALVANASAEEFLRQVWAVKPDYAALASEEIGKQIADKMPQGVKFAYGEDAAVEGVCYGDTALIAATGFAGLKYSLRAVEEGKNIALANKETLVCGGELTMGKIKAAGVDLTPIDSEHSAIWQALNFRKDATFKKLIITASGGPFYGKTQAELAKVTAKDALKHPTWQMGAKITIDSATLLNKGFEVIEAKWLYDTTPDKIKTVVQPESIIHSMVEFDDGCVMAQMSYPTMELPIQLALTYPERFDCNLASLDFEKLGQIRFLPLKREDFPCYDLALTALESGDNYPCALNGAGEVAVHAFLKDKIPFTAIADVISYAMGKTERVAATDYALLKDTDGRARAYAEEYIKSR